MLMSRRYVLPALGALLLFLQTPSSLPAQEARTLSGVAASAKNEAILESGLVRVPGSSSQMVARGLYVKLREGYDEGNPTAAAARIASRAGLRPEATSHLPYINAPLEGKLAARIQSLPGEELMRVRKAEESLGRIVELHYGAAMSPLDAARVLSGMPEVEYAEPIYLPNTLGGSSAPPNDPMVQQQFQLNLVKLLNAWEIWKGDSNMVIAIVDAGVDMFHEDLAPNIKENPGEVGVDANGQDKRTNKIDDDNNGVVDDWRGANLTYQLDGTLPGDTKGSSHGTEVAGLAAAKTNNGLGIAGAGYNSRFFPVKAAANNGGPLVRAYEGIIYSARRGFKVINCSFGSDQVSQALQDIITGLTTAYDCAIVAAAGNDAIYSNFYPAGYKNVLGVGGLAPDNDFRTTWGEQVDVSSTAGFSTGNNNTYYELGPATSYATPIVSGIMALVRSKYPALSAEQAIAHVRLTADPIFPPVPDMSKLTGFGRVNALRAVSIDPFSHPAIVVDSAWMTDDQGNIRERIAVGGKGRLMVRLRNLLGGASNITVRAIAYRDDSTVVSISKTSVPLASLGRGEVKDLETGIPFEVRQPNSSRVRIRFEILADGGYTDYQYDRMLFYLPYITVRTPRVTASLTDKGRLGFEDFPENSIGAGVRYDDASFLSEGGLIIASNRGQVLSNIRGSSGDTPDSDFATLSYPGTTNNGTLTLNDAPAGTRRIGLEVKMRMIAVDSVPEGLGIEVRTRNVSAGPIDTLRLALFTDWDIDSMTAEQSVGYMERPRSNVPFFGRLQSSSGYYITQGVAASGTPDPLPVFYAIRNDAAPVNIYDGFTTEEKWTTVSNGIGSRTADAGDDGDISLVLGKRVVNLARDAEDTTLFVIGFSSIGYADAEATMKSLAPERLIGAAVTGGTAMPGMLMGTPLPNPSRGAAVIEIHAPLRGATLRVFDAMGRQVADLTGELGPDGTASRVRFDGSALPNGVYQIQLVSPAGSETRQLVLAR